MHYLFLATTEKHKILPTHLVALSDFELSRISISDTVAHLQYVAASEGVKADADALNVIAQKSDG
jgi:DNA polymerase-3 subunit gamma/tau